TDGIDMRHVGTHLRVHFDEAAVGDGHAGLVGCDLHAVRAAAHCHQHHVIELRLRRSAACFGGFEGDLDAFLQCLDAYSLGLQHDAVEALLVELLPYLDQVTVCALHQAIHHFDHVDACAERGINRCHFQADDAAADDEHLLRHTAQLQRAGGIHDARVFR